MSEVARGAVIIGTAGHIDHGKTSLVRLLTGQETDRLQAERERGISIELGFAHYDIDGRRFGVVDVPGHERFIRNMLAGAHGIDLVLFVVAADDGIMPQTEEHLDILHLLGVRRGIFVLTKIDLVDASRVAEVRADIEVLACDTVLEGAPICAVSNATGEGLDALRAEIARQVLSLPARTPRGYFRLPIDRAFVLQGHGVVVTGTAVSGTVFEGDLLAIRPLDAEVRARSVQVHGVSVKQASAGQRVAINLSGADPKQAERGQVLADPRLHFMTDRFDCRFEVRPAARRPIRSFDRIRVYIGTAERMARLIVLGGREELAPKSSGFCQVVLEEPILAAAGDRFIARTEAATRTIGGGSIVQPFATRHRAREEGLEEALTVLEKGDAPARVHALLGLVHEFAAEVERVAQALGLTVEEVRAAAAAESRIIALPEAARPEALTSREKWERLGTVVRDALEAFHRAHPLAAGMELESLRSRLPVPLPQKLFRPAVARLQSEGVVAREEALVRLPSHRVRLDRAEQDVATRVREAIASGRFTPPDVRQLQVDLELPQSRLLEILQVLEKEGALVRVAPDLYFDAAALERARGLLGEFLAEKPEITAAEFRNLLSASRKYAIALLDHFDRAAVTVRVGDARRLRRM
ncbi:MAG TPA: selenocysteine-specific translation elongation factor [Candidatus Bathyarchaeia archaeon]|nr:selenocysteine-specific translation elongation factor [Candidatus Bathyarchaeia archaeon]